MDLSRQDSTFTSHTSDPILTTMSLKQRFDQTGDSDEESEPPVGCADSLKESISEFSCSNATTNLLYRYKTYLTFTWRDVRKRKVSYCLGTCSCFMVVFTIAVMLTMLENMPLIILRLAETETAERDVIIVAGSEASESRSLDYTEFSKALLPMGPDYSFHSPRLEFLTNQAYTMNPVDCHPPEGEEDPFQPPMNWIYKHENVNCSRHLTECLNWYCYIRHPANVHVIDTEREKTMGLGREWPYDPIKPGHAIVKKGLADEMALSAGDTMVVSLTLSPPLLGMFRDVGLGRMEWPYAIKSSVTMTVTIQDVFTDNHGKLSSDNSVVFMELEPFLSHVALFMHEDIPDSTREYISQTPKLIEKYVTSVTINLNPSQRLSLYENSEYKSIQNDFINWISPAILRVGFNQIEAEAEILEYMYGTRFFSMFLGLLMSLVIFVFVVLSVILIYSLLMINVDTRTFELGVLRMVGMKRRDVIQLVLVQAMLYTIPAIITGMLAAYGTWIMLKGMLEDSLVLSLPSELSPLSVGVALLIGLTIPVIASIAPIVKAVSLSLQESLDTRRAKTKVITYELSRSDSTTVSIEVLVLGASLTTFGFLIYYMFPLALLTTNILLLLWIFFGILLGMLFGLVLLSLNFEHLLERLLTAVFLFWENEAVKVMLVKNLVAHRPRNRKTTLMYSMSLSFIIWMMVSVDLQIRSVSAGVSLKYGGDIIVEKGDIVLTWLEASRVERALEEKAHLVKDWGYVTESLEHYDGLEDEDLASLGRLKVFSTKTIGVSPNLFADVVHKEFLKPSNENKNNGASLSAQLYASDAYDSAIIGTYFSDLFSINKYGHPRENDHSFLLQTEWTTPEKDQIDVRTPFKALAALDSGPVLRFSKFPARKNQDSVVSILTQIGLSNRVIQTVDDIDYDQMVIRLEDGWTSDTVDEIEEAIQAAMAPDLPKSALKISDVKTDKEAAESTGDILNLFFYVVTLLTMILCFFSLLASMYTNIHEQSKEIGVLRSLGLQRFPTKRIYVWEAFILLFSASVMGFAVGTVVAYTLLLQRQLFLELPLTLNFPYVLFFFVVIVGFFCSVMASWSPITVLLKCDIVSILRKTG
eukprot:TRINITY_DN17355_c0_g1_i1.p1 TRINITY_DN17355_c0_g1~~TRINITY_DN17355_c0_g1_i1.p1  ORF type:complete len:1106 (+),score=147.38 TRINITY_DN17355_c0_g1_i1:33-3320(+)